MVRDWNAPIWLRNGFDISATVLLSSGAVIAMQHVLSPEASNAIPSIWRWVIVALLAAGIMCLGWGLVRDFSSKTPALTDGQDALEQAEIEILRKAVGADVPKTGKE